MAITYPCCMLEFRSHTHEKPNVVCATIKRNTMDFDNCSGEYFLKIGYTENDFYLFLESIDFDYDDTGVTGTIWYDDGTWSEKPDGDFWLYRKCPTIPKTLEDI